MEIEGVSGVGQVITSGTAGYNSLNGRQPQNTALGGSGSDYYSGGGGNNGNGYFNGSSNGGSGGGGATAYSGGNTYYGGVGGGAGGTININSQSSLSINGALSSGGGSGGGASYGGGGGGGAGGTININSQSSLSINGALSNNGGSGGANYGGSGGGGAGGTINITSQSSLSISNTLSSNSVGGGAGGTINLNSGTNFLSSNNISASKILVSAGNNINIGETSTLTASGAVGTIEMVSCGKTTIAGKLYAYTGGTDQNIVFLASVFEAITPSQLKAGSSITIIYTASCNGLNHALCPNIGTAVLQPVPIVIYDPSALPVGCVAGPPGNLAPYEPINPVPTMGDDGQSLCLSLSWQSGDLEGDLLDFEIYFGDDFALVDGLDPSALITTLYNQASDSGGAYVSYSYSLADSPGLCDLINSTVYYWKIKARDNL